MKELKESKEFEIRFSEVDSMNVVWHGYTRSISRMPARLSARNTGWNT